MDEPQAAEWIILSDSLGSDVVPDAGGCKRCGVVAIYVDRWGDRCPVCAILDALNLWPSPLEAEDG